MRIAAVVTHITYLLRENFVSMNTLQTLSLFALLWPLGLLRCAGFGWSFYEISQTRKPFIESVPLSFGEHPKTKTYHLDLRTETQPALLKLSLALAAIGGPDTTSFICA